MHVGEQRQARKLWPLHGYLGHKVELTNGLHDLSQWFVRATTVLDIQRLKMWQECGFFSVVNKFQKQKKVKKFFQQQKVPRRMLQTCPWCANYGRAQFFFESEYFELSTHMICWNQNLYRKLETMCSNFPLCLFSVHFCSLRGAYARLASRRSTFWWHTNTNCRVFFNIDIDWPSRSTW